VRVLRERPGTGKARLAVASRFRALIGVAVRSSHSRLICQGLHFNYDATIRPTEAVHTLRVHTHLPSRRIQNNIVTMEDDTRQPDGQQPPKPKGPANIMPGGSAHTAGGNKDDIGPSYFEVVRNLGPEYYLNFHKRPCVRDGQLTGIGAGFVGGSLAAILGSKSSRICAHPIESFLTYQRINTEVQQHCSTHLGSRWVRIISILPVPAW
jgi:hypothetical protein